MVRFAAFEARMEEALKRIEDVEALRAEARNRVREALEALRMAQSPGPKRPKPPKPRKRRPGESGEPVPAVPRPKPKPLSGGAAAPIERTRKLKKSVSSPLRVKDRPVKVPSEADQGRFL